MFVKSKKKKIPFSGFLSWFWWVDWVSHQKRTFSPHFFLPYIQQIKQTINKTHLNGESVGCVKNTPTQITSRIIPIETLWLNKTKQTNKHSMFVVVSSLDLVTVHVYKKTYFPLQKHLHYFVYSTSTYIYTPLGCSFRSRVPKQRCHSLPTQPHTTLTHIVSIKLANVTVKLPTTFLTRLSQSISIPRVPFSPVTA